LILPDVSVLVYAHRRDAADHAAFRDWLESLLNGDESYGITRQVLGSFIRESGSEWITTDRDFSRFKGCAGGTR
jgi:predicted nucleic acid-binding protein